jgi:hypothetical protein
MLCAILPRVNPGAGGLAWGRDGGALAADALAVEDIVQITRAVEPGAAAAAFTVPAGRRLVVTDVITGILCVPALSSMTLALTTGLELGAGQSVLLGNQAAAPSATTAATTGALHYHLRGFLVTG